LVVPYIEGVQSQGVIATVKHYALNNQEYNRHNVDSEADERTMRELYFPAFEAAVTKGHVDAVMNSYNLINGSHATQNEFLNLKVLKGEWGFQGILMSDWDATYDTVGAANNGLDLEMPGPRFMNPKALLAAIHEGEIKESTIDEKLLRIFRTEIRYGFADRPQFDPAVSTYSVAARAVALQGALESITLLKNEGRLLPLDASKIKTIAVIGPNAWPAVSGGGGSSNAQAFEPVSMLTGIANLAGSGVHVLYSRGLPSENDLFDNTHWQGRVKVETYSSNDFTGTPEVANQRNVSEWKPSPWDVQKEVPRSIRYSAAFKADKDGKYLILAAAAGEDAFTVSVDGKQLLQQIHAEGQVPQSATLQLTAGQTVNVVADYVPHAPGVRLGLGMAFEADLVSEEARQFAVAADVTVVAAGFNELTEGEGQDRTFTLPWGQDALIEAVSHANPRTIVTLTGGGGMDTRRWLAQVPRIAPRLVSRPGRRHRYRRSSLRQAQPRRQAPRQLRPQLGRKPLLQLLLPHPRRRHHAPRHRDGRKKSRLRHPPHQVRRQAHGRLSLLDHHRQAPALSLRLRPQLHHLQLLEARSARQRPIRLARHRHLRRNQHRQRGRRRSSPALRLRSLRQSQPPRARTERLPESPPRPGETKHVDARPSTPAPSATGTTPIARILKKWTIDPGKFVISRQGDSSENSR
jgi:hypothetical protein